MRFILKALVVIFISTFMWGCSSVQPTSGSAQPKTTSSVDRAGYAETGKASFYADKHQSKKTASGEIYDYKLNTAAHRTLPFGTKVRVTNMENGKSVVVKINDRGPFVKNRILDLSQSAFRSIADASSGVIEVKIEIIE
jgi:rare lipoprotein A